MRDVDADGFTHVTRSSKRKGKGVSKQKNNVQGLIPTKEEQNNTKERRDKFIRY